MTEAVWDQGFKRSYRKRVFRIPHLKKQFRDKMALFLEEPHNLGCRCPSPKGFL